MLSYRYGHMSMDGNRDGTDRVSTADVFADGFLVAPTDMNTDMHMFGLMYAPANWLTLMAIAGSALVSVLVLPSMLVIYTRRSERSSQEPEGEGTPVLSAGASQSQA